METTSASYAMSRNTSSSGSNEKQQALAQFTRAQYRSKKCSTCSNMPPCNITYCNGSSVVLVVLVLVLVLVLVVGRRGRQVALEQGPLTYGLTGL